MFVEDFFGQPRILTVFIERQVFYRTVSIASLVTVTELRSEIEPFEHSSTDAPLERKIPSIRGGRYPGRITKFARHCSLAQQSRPNFRLKLKKKSLKK